MSNNETDAALSTAHITPELFRQKFNALDSVDPKLSAQYLEEVAEELYQMATSPMNSCEEKLAAAKKMCGLASYGPQTEQDQMDEDGRLHHRSVQDRAIAVITRLLKGVRGDYSA